MEPIKNNVTEPIKPIFKKPSIVGLMTWMGTIIASVSAVAYLIIVYILVKGFSTNVESNKLFVFLALGAADGVLISSALRFQGVTFAKSLPSNQNQIKAYTELLGTSKTTKLKPLWHMYLVNGLVDVIMKGGSVLFTMYFTISIMIEGMHDDKYFVLGIINVLTYLGLGLLALGKGYDHYNEKQVPYLEQKIIKMKQEQEKPVEEPEKVGNKDVISKEITRDVREGLWESNGSGRDLFNSVEERPVGGSDQGER